MKLPGLRNVVRATHDWPVAKQLYRRIYHRAAAAAGRLAESHSSLIGIYARNSYALGTFVAGISDIDLTLVWRNASREDRRKFDADWARLRRIYPMLGETEMLEQRHVAAWTTHAVGGLESRRWLRLGGDYELPETYAGNERLDRLRQAVSIYRYNLWPLLAADADAGSFLRFTAKLFRQLGKAPPQANDPRKLMPLCRRELSAAIASFPFDDRAPLVAYEDLCPAKFKPLSAVPPCLAALGREHDSAPRYLLVAPDSEEAVAMDRTLFRFYLCYVDPLEYFSLLRGRTCFHGDDPLFEPFPLSQRALRQTVRSYAVQILTFPYRRAVAKMPEDEFRNVLYGWLLRTLCFFEDGRMHFPFDELREHFGQRHLETAKDRDALLLGICDELSHHLLVSEA